MSSFTHFSRAVLKRGRFYAGLAVDRLRRIDEATIERFSNVRNFCFFVGHPRSGHTIVRSVLDAHPNIVISDELNALAYLRAGASREQLFSAIIRHARAGARKGNWRGEYNYAVRGMHQGESKDIRVIGDKNGGRSSKALSQNPMLLDKLICTVGLPVKVIHIVRNPYDNVSTAARKSLFSMQHNIDEYFERTSINERVLKQVGPKNGITIYQEDFLNSPQRVIESLCQFLGVDVNREYLDACATIVNPKPNKTRFKTKWNSQDLNHITAKIGEHPLLQRYVFEETEASSVAS